MDSVTTSAIAKESNGVVNDLYVSPIADTMNVRFVENHITIGRPAKSVFDWVTTWGNLPKWLVATSGTKLVSGGPLDKPSHQGDVLIAVAPPESAVAAGFKAQELEIQYTVVARIDGFLWAVAGQFIVDGRPSDLIRSAAIFAVQPKSDKSCLLTRLFQSVRPDIVNPVNRPPVDDPVVAQRWLEIMKEVIEREVPES